MTRATRIESSLLRCGLHWVLFVALWLPTNCMAQKQPQESDYPHKSVVRTHAGLWANDYHLFEPADPKPAKAPVITFLHGHGFPYPIGYQAWINHLVRKGNIVVFPVYQNTFLDLACDAATCQGILSAIKLLQTGDHVRPDLDRTASVGHSHGGVLAANLGAIAEKYGLPVPKAIMSVQPGISLLFPLADLSKIPAQTRLCCVAGDIDLVVGQFDAQKIYRATTQIPAENKQYLLLRTIVDGGIADHGAAACPALGNAALVFPYSVDSLDFLMWEKFDAMLKAAFGTAEASD